MCKKNQIFEGQGRGLKNKTNGVRNNKHNTGTRNTHKKSPRFEIRQYRSFVFIKNTKAGIRNHKLKVAGLKS